MKKTPKTNEFKVMNKLVILSVITTIILMVVFCTDKNVNREQGNIFSIDSGSFYLRRVIIDGDKIYFVVDQDGNPIIGATASQNKYIGNHSIKKHITSVVLKDTLE